MLSRAVQSHLVGRYLQSTMCLVIALLTIGSVQAVHAQSAVPPRGALAQGQPSPEPPGASEMIGAEGWRTEAPIWGAGLGDGPVLQRRHQNGSWRDLAPAFGGEGGAVRTAADLAASPVITFNITSGSVTGYTTPDQAVHLLLQRGAATVGEARTRTDGAGWFSADLMFNGRWAQVQPGDTLDVVVGATTTALVAPSFTGNVNVAADSLTGLLAGPPLPVAMLVECWGNTVAVTTDGAGAYNANLGGQIDVAWLHTVNAGYRDANGNWIVATFSPQNGIAVSPTYAEVSGATTPGATVQVTLTHGATQSTATGTADRRSGWWYINFEEIQPGDLVAANIGGVVVASTVADLAGDFDLPADRMTGNGPANSAVSVYAHRHTGFTAGYVWQGAPTDGTGAFVAAFPAGTLDSQQWALIAHHNTAQADTWIEEDPQVATVRWPDNVVFGYADPGAVVNATLLRGGMLESVQAVARAGYGYYEASFSNHFQIGDQVTVAGGGVNTTIDLVNLTTRLDIASDTLAGQAPAGARLFGGTWGFNGFGPFWADFITAGGDGNYHVALGDRINVHNGRYAWVSHPESNDAEHQGWQQTYAVTPYLELNETHDGIWGYVPAADVPVTLTLMTGGGVPKGQVFHVADGYGNFGWQQFRNDNGNLIAIDPGDRVRAEIPGWSQEVAAGGTVVTVDAATDRVSGVGPANSYVEVRVRWYRLRLRFPTAADGTFMVDLGGLTDITPGMQVEAIVFDANWNAQLAIGEAPRARANVAWDNVDGWFGPGVSVQYTVTTPAGTPKGGAAGTAKPDGWMDGVWCNCDLLPGDRVHVTSSAGLDALLVPITITGRIDVTADRVAGVMQGGEFPGRGNVWVWSDTRQEGSGTDFDIAADGSFSVEITDFDIWPGDSAEVWYYDANNHQVGTEFDSLRMDVNYAHDWVEVRTVPYEAVTVTVTGKAAVHGQADGSGRFGTWGGVWSPNAPDIEPGDAVLVVAAGETKTVDPVGTIAGAIDLANDTVAGTIQAPGWTGDLRVRCEVWVDDGPPGITTNADAAGGAYTCDFGAEGWDIVSGQDVAVRYYEPDGDRVINVFGAPYARANITWDGVDGWFGPGVSVQYTVTTAGGAPKGGGSGVARSDGWLDGVGCGCDLIPGDRIHVTSSAGFDAQITPIPITGHFDVANDRVMGVMQNGVFPARGRVDLSSDGRDAWRAAAIDIAADGAYVADFSGSFDLTPGDRGEVWYIDPAGNWLGKDLYALNIEVAYDGDFISARTEPGATITITVAGKATLTGQADADGRVEGWNDEWQALWRPSQPNIMPGDTVIATAAGWTKQVNPVGWVTAEANLATDTVAGDIHASGFSENLRVHCEVWEDDGPPRINAVPGFVNPDGGSFVCDFSEVGWELRYGDTMAVRYYELDSDQVIHSFWVQAMTYLPVIHRR